VRFINKRFQKGVVDWGFALFGLVVLAIVVGTIYSTVENKTTEEGEEDKSSYEKLNDALDVHDPGDGSCDDPDVLC